MWNKIAETPGKEVKVRAKDSAYVLRIRKAVWKEKDRCSKIVTVDGKRVHFRSLYRLTCEILPDGLTLIFKLVPSKSEFNI